MSRGDLPQTTSAVLRSRAGVSHVGEVALGATVRADLDAFDRQHQSGVHARRAAPRADASQLSDAQLLAAIRSVDLARSPFQVRGAIARSHAAAARLLDRIGESPGRGCCG